MTVVYGIGLHYKGVSKVFSTREKAEAYILEQGANGYYYIKEMEVG